MSRIGVSDDLSKKIAQMSFVCACLVVLIHIPMRKMAAPSFSNWLMLFLSEGLARIAVPFFFVVSGYFLAIRSVDDGWYLSAVRKRVRTLVCPYVTWCLLYGVLVNGIVLVANLSAHRGVGENVIGLVKIFGLDFNEYPLLIPLWYLRALFLLVLMSPLLVGLVSKGRALAFGVLGGLLIMSLSRPILTNPLYGFIVSGLGESGVFYFTIGIVLARQHLKIRMPTYLSAALFGIGLCLFGLKVTLWGNWWDRESLVCAAVFHGAVLSTLCGAWMLFRPVKWLVPLQSYSFAIYLLHAVVFFVIGRVVPAHGIRFVYYAVWFVVGVFGSALACRLITAILPSRVVKFLFGGRNG